MLDLYKVTQEIHQHGSRKKPLMISEKQIVFSITVTGHCKPNCEMTVILCAVSSVSPSKKKVGSGN